MAQATSSSTRAQNVDLSGLTRANSRELNRLPAGPQVSTLQVAGNNYPPLADPAFVPDPTADSPLRMLADLLF